MFIYDGIVILLHRNYYECLYTTKSENYYELNISVVILLHKNYYECLYMMEPENYCELRVVIKLAQICFCSLSKRPPPLFKHFLPPKEGDTKLLFLSSFFAKYISFFFKMECFRVFVQGISFFFHKNNNMVDGKKQGRRKKVRL